MAVTLKQVEALPASYPDITGTITSAQVAALDTAAIWQRIEAYTAHRWTPRAVVWTVEGAGDWAPPLAPATISKVEVWLPGADWAEISLLAGPYGWEMPGDGPYRVTATVGGGDVPAAVQEAFRRLAGYLGDSDKKAGASRHTFRMGDLEEAYERAPSWVARAMINSGASDLLRPYRSV